MKEGIYWDNLSKSQQGNFRYLLHTLPLPFYILIFLSNIHHFGLSFKINMENQ